MASIILPPSPLSWWATSNISRWNEADSDSGACKLEPTSLDWQRSFTTALSLPTANWQMCPPLVLPSPQTPPTSLNLYGRIATVDFPANELKLVLNSDTKAALLEAYDHLMKAKGNGGVSADERVLRKATMRRQLDSLIVSLACSALVCTSGSTGAGSFVDYKHEESGHGGLPAPMLDMVLGVRKYIGRGLPDLIKSLFTIPPTSNLSSPAQAVSPQKHMRKNSLARRQLDISEATMERAQTGSSSTDVTEETYFEAMSDERRAWAEYRIQPAPPTAKRAKTARPTKKRKTQIAQAQPVVRSQPKRTPRAANIYEDARGGKCRRSSAEIRRTTDDNIIHTDIAAIEAGLRKQRITPDYASSDSGLGLMSPPGGTSRYSKTPELEMTDVVHMGDLLLKDTKYNIDWLKNDFSMTSRDYDSSSDDDDDEMDIAPPLQTYKRRIPATDKSPFDIPSVAPAALPKARGGFLSRKRKSCQKSLPVEEPDYTDQSDLELDSDTPLHELLVDSEDEEEHVRRKIARRLRKRVKRSTALPVAA